MAIAVQTISAVARAVTTTTLTITKPTGLIVGDLMVAYMASNGTTSTRVWTILSGWTSIVNKTDVINATQKVSHVAMYKIADSGDVAASDFTFTCSTSDRLAGVIYRIDGSAVSAVVNDDNGPDSEAIINDETPLFTLSSLTPTVASCLLLFLCAHSEGNSTSKTTSAQAIATSNPTWNEDFDNHNSTNLTIAGASAVRPETTATGNASYTSSGDATTDCALIIVAINPIVNATVTPAVVAVAGSLQAPVIVGGAIIASDVVVGTASIPALVVGENKWRNSTKNSASFTNQSKS